MIKLENVTKKYVMGDNIVMALNGIDIHIDEGEFVAIVGPSGSGKSTLMNIIGCLDVVTGGYYELNQIPIQDYDKDELADIRNQQIGFVFQQYNLIPNLTAIENVMLALEFGGYPAKKRQARAEQLLTDVGIESDQQVRKPAKLSGGQQQRVSIARALANKPAIIFADEPTGNLDSETGKKIFDLLHRLSRSEKTTIIAVTHDMDIAGRTDKTFKLKDGKITD